jgi:protease-4
MTITGSIGVFGVFFTAQELLEETFKLRFDGVKTHQFADLGTLSRDLSPAEMELLEGNVTRTYGKFLNRVASGRNLDSLYVDSIGQGRVWMGPDAIQNKLADAQGGLFDAIEIVNQMAGLEADYKVVAYPKPMDPLTKILKQLNIETVSDARLRSELGPFYNDWKQLQKVLHRRGIQARMELELQP